jgi:hypothetical protein
MLGRSLSRLGEVFGSRLTLRLDLMLGERLGKSVGEVG